MSDVQETKERVLKHYGRLGMKWGKSIFGSKNRTSGRSNKRLNKKIKALRSQNKKLAKSVAEQKATTKSLKKALKKAGKTKTSRKERMLEKIREKDYDAQREREVLNAYRNRSKMSTRDMKKITERVKAENELREVAYAPSKARKKAKAEKIYKRIKISASAIKTLGSMSDSTLEAMAKRSGGDDETIESRTKQYKRLRDLVKNAGSGLDTLSEAFNPSGKKQSALIEGDQPLLHAGKKGMKWRKGAKGEQQTPAQTQAEAQRNIQRQLIEARKAYAQNERLVKQQAREKQRAMLKKQREERAAKQRLKNSKTYRESVRKARKRRELARQKEVNE